MKNIRFYIFIFLISGMYNIKAQTVINGYAKVTAITGNVLTVSNVNETGDSFEDGERVIIMQMQDNVIGNTTNTSSFGEIGASILNAGKYELATISSHTEAASLPNQITLSASLLNTYNINANSSVQIISYPELGTPDYTTTFDIVARDWDGIIGGVLAFRVAGVFTLEHNIIVTAKGFLGGAANNDASSGGCDGSANYRTAVHNERGRKGEGIYKATDINYVSGRGKILNGGGGGNSHNAGGGGGGNVYAGGDGGPGFPNCSPSAGGYGGIALGSYITGDRIFMGGGGGAGECNNGGAKKGGDGAGILLIAAGTIKTVGTGANIYISAIGASVSAGSGGDGNSGGGAGGTIVFDVDNWNISATKKIIVQANGGKGGDVTDAATHGAGGGGSMGAIINNGASVPTNATFQAVSGAGGLNCTSCASAASGAGVSGAGVFANISGPLPVEFAEFAVYQSDDFIELLWMTASEHNNDYFIIQRSLDGQIWENIATQIGSGNSVSAIEYTAIDKNPYWGLSYYRLKQVDFDGKYDYSIIQQVYFDNSNTIVSVYPIPCIDRFTIKNIDAEDAEINIFDQYGGSVNVPIIRDFNTIEITTIHLVSGIYYVQIINKNETIVKQMIRK